MSDLFEKLPKYIQIKEALRREIDKGFLKVGQQLASETALIERFDASKMTVIRALQELVQEGYLRRVQGKGTYVTRPELRTPLIGVLIPRIDEGVFPVILHRIEEHAHMLGYEIVFCSTDDNVEKATTFAMRLTTLKVAGVIATPLGRVPNFDADQNWYNYFEKYDIPVVLLDRGMRQAIQSPVVQTNNEEAMAALTRIVIEYGHQRIFMVSLEEFHNPSTKARIQSFQRTVNQYGNQVGFSDVIALSEKKSFQYNLHQLKTLIDEYKPTVLMSINDQIAIDMIRMLKFMPPEYARNISVTGFDDIPVADVIGLTTVHQPLLEEGEKAVELLHSLIQRENADSVTLASEVVIRTSLHDLRKELSPVEDPVLR